MPTGTISDGLSLPKISWYYLVAIAFFIAVVAFLRLPHPYCGEATMVSVCWDRFGPGWLTWTTMSVNPELFSRLLDELPKYLILVLAAERAVAVYVDNMRSQSIADWGFRIKRIQDVLAANSPSVLVLKQVYDLERPLLLALKKKQIIESLPQTDFSDMTPAESYIASLVTTLQVYEFQRGRYQSVTNRYVIRWVFLAGIGFACLGVSVLDDIISNIEELAFLQQLLVQAADIVVTGGLLGGGSLGLSKFSSHIANSLKNEGQT